MQADKSDIITRLRSDILSLQGLKPAGNEYTPDMGLGPIRHAFPGKAFPLAAVHEFISSAVEDAAVTTGFVASLVAPLMRKGDACIWIGSSRMVFPPALQAFGIAPDKVIFIQLQKEKEMLWVMEEALKCEGLAAVIGEIRQLSFTASRRLQLAVEKSKVTGFILRHQPKTLNTTACVTRWKISPLASQPEDEMPGVGFPRWKVELLKVRNGRPGTWEVEYRAGKFRHIYQEAAQVLPHQKKAV